MWWQSRRRREQRELLRRLCAIEGKLDALTGAVANDTIRQEELFMTNQEAVEQLTAKVSAVTSVVGSAVTLVTGVSERLGQLAGEINSQPGGTQFAEKLIALGDSLTAAKDDIARAVEQGTQALRDTDDEAAAGGAGGATEPA